MKHSYEIEEYVTERGKSPFGEWYLSLKDKVAQVKIRARLTRISVHGNFGDHKPIKGAENIYELREHYGAGYRIFYTIIEGRVVLLLAGSNKKDQKRAIAKAETYLADYQRR